MLPTSRSYPGWLALAILDRYAGPWLEPSSGLDLSERWQNMVQNLFGGMTQGMIVRAPSAPCQAG